MSKRNGFDIDPAAWAKFDPELRRTLTNIQADPTIELPVMITLTAPAEPLAAVQAEPPSREERVQLAAERQVAFDHEVADLVQELEQLGARDLQLFWINRTVSARLTLPALEAAGKREEVKQIILAVRRKAIATPID